MTLFIVTNWRYKAEELILGLFFYYYGRAVKPIPSKYGFTSWKSLDKIYVSIYA